MIRVLRTGAVCALAWLATLMSFCSAGESTRVERRDGGVQLNEQMEDRAPQSTTSETSGAQLISKTFLPPKDRSFLAFPKQPQHPRATFVDILRNADAPALAWADKRITDTKDAIKVQDAYAASNAALFPLQAEGLIEILIEIPGGVGNQPPPVWHWAAQVAKDDLHIRVERRPGGNVCNAYGMSLHVSITVTGNNLNQYDIRMLIRSGVEWWHWNGQPMTVVEILGELRADPVVVDTNGQWVTDTGWDWQALRPNGNQAVLGDLQLINVTNRYVRLPGQNGRFLEVRRASQHRSFRIELRDRNNNNQIVATEEWGYRWTNENATWTAQHNPPAPDPSCAGAHIGEGDIVNVYGIAGVPWW